MTTGEERLPRAQPADDGGEAGRAAHLLGQPRVPRHRAAGGGARLADHDAAPVAHARGGGGHGRRRPRDRAATAVGRGRQRLAGDELARVAVLRLGVLDLDLRPVEVEHLLRPRERLGLVLARDGDAPPAVQPGVELGEPAGELVLDLQHPVGLAGQRHRRIEIVVVGVVPDLRADLAHLPLQLARHLLGLADVDARRPLHGERQPIGVLHPRVVDLGDAQAVHQPEGEDGDVARDRLRPQPTHHPHRGRVGLLVHVDAVGERRQVLGLPAVDRPGHHRERPRRGQPQRARAVHEPREVVGARGDGVEAAARDQHVEVAHLGGRARPARPAPRRAPACPAPATRRRPSDPACCARTPRCRGRPPCPTSRGPSGGAARPPGSRPSPSAPATSGRRPSALLSNDSAHMCTGYGRVVTRRCTHRPCSSPSCDAIWRISTSRWESLRKLHACAASRYHAITCVDVRVRCPSIDRNAMLGRYLGSPASPASARLARRLGGCFSRFGSRRATGPPLRPFPTAG